MTRTGAAAAATWSADRWGAGAELSPQLGERSASNESLKNRDRDPAGIETMKLQEVGRNVEPKTAVRA